MNKRKVGGIYEGLACDYLRDKGYEILERNYFTRRGELDIIAREGETTVFVEVKYRSSIANGEPYEAVTPTKLMHLMKAAEYYLISHGGMERRARFDVVSILKTPAGYKIKHLKNVTG